MDDTHRYRPPSIADYGGIEAYLEDAVIKKNHNNLGLKEFKLRIKLGVPQSKIRDDFGLKSTGTVRRWKKLLGL